MSSQSVAKTQETLLFSRESGGTVEDPFGRGLSLGLQNPPSGAHFRLKTNIIPWMGSNMPFESSTLAFKSNLNAHALPMCAPKPLKPHFSGAQMSTNILLPVLQNSRSGVHFLEEPWISLDGEQYASRLL